VITNDWLTRASRLPTSERMSVSQRRRRIYILRLIERYRFDMKLEPLGERMLKAEARSYDQQLTYAGVPTDRLHAVYLEAMASHPESRFLNLTDFTRAWLRLQDSASERFRTRSMRERGAACVICNGTGMTETFIPKNYNKPEAGGTTVQKECPYHCKRASSLRILNVD
jgi:hypothetical protein